MKIIFFDKIKFFNRQILYKKYLKLEILLKNKGGINNGNLE